MLWDAGSNLRRRRKKCSAFVSVYRVRLKGGTQVAWMLQAKLGRSGKQENNSSNLGTTFQPSPVCAFLDMDFSYFTFWLTEWQPWHLLTGWLKVRNVLLNYKLIILVRYKRSTGFSSEIGTKLGESAIGQAGGSCYSRAALSSNDSKTL